MVFGGQGAKPSHDTYVTLLNQASAALNLDIATMLAEQLPFNHGKNINDMVRDLRLAKVDLVRQ